MFENYDFGENVVEKYLDFQIDSKYPIEQQLDFCKKDMLKVSYKNRLTIDIGWCPPFEKNGSFKISLIKDGNRDSPVFEKTCNDLLSLKVYLDECISYCRYKIWP